MSLVYEDDQDSIHPWKVIASQVLYSSFSLFYYFSLQNLNCKEHVFLIDHAWTFELNKQRKLLLHDAHLRGVIHISITYFQLKL